MLSCHLTRHHKEENTFKNEQNLKNKFQTQTAIYKKALIYFHQSQYKKSKILLEKLEPEVTLKSLKFLILYNLGRNYEALNECKKAETKYRELIHLSFEENEFKVLNAKSLLRLGYIYECLNENSKTIGSFLSTREKRELLSNFTIQVEIPLRLALAYSRLGSWKVAEEFFKSSKKAFKKYAVFLFNEKKKWSPKEKKLVKDIHSISNLDRSFYGIQELKIRLKALGYMQEYLIKIFQTKNISWSKRVLETIKSAYKRIGTEIQESKSISQELKNELTLLLIKNLHQIKIESSLQLKPGDLKFLLNQPSWFQRIFLNKKKLKWNQLKKNLLSFTLNQEIKWTLSSKF